MTNHTAQPLTRVLDIPVKPFTDDPRSKATDVNTFISDRALYTVAPIPQPCGYKCHHCEIKTNSNTCNQLACSTNQRSDRADIIFIKLI